MSFIWYNESSYYIDLPRDFDIHINIYYISISIVSISMLVPLISWYFRIKPTTFNLITMTDGYLCIGSSGLGNTYCKWPRLVQYIDWVYKQLPSNIKESHMIYYKLAIQYQISNKRQESLWLSPPTLKN